MSKKSFYSTQPASHKGITNTWYTPEYIIDALGPFDLDPCSNSTRPFNTATKHMEHDLGEDGLILEWGGGSMDEPTIWKTYYGMVG